MKGNLPFHYNKSPRDDPLRNFYRYHKHFLISLISDFGNRPYPVTIERLQAINLSMRGSLFVINPYQLLIFQTVASEESISRAADALFMSQPAVSQHIKALEQDLGVTLFRRGRKGVQLTPAGEVLLEYAQTLLQLSQEARREVKKAATKGSQRLRQVHVGASPGIGSCLLPKWIQLFYQYDDDLSLSIRIALTPNLVHQVAGHHLAFAVTGDPLTKGIVEMTPLWEEEAAIIVGRGHPWWGRSHIPAHALLDQDFIMREESSLARAWELQSLAEYGVHPRAVAEFTAPAAIKQAVMANMGIALLPCFSVDRELASGQLHAVRLEEGVLGRRFSLLWTPASLKSEGVRTLFRFLVAFADELAFRPLQSPSEHVRRVFNQSTTLRKLLKGLPNEAA